MNRDEEHLQLLAIFHYVVAGLGALFFLAGVTMAICILIAGRSLALRKNYSFAMVIACIEMPLHSIRNDSWRVYDRCSFARVGERIILHSDFERPGLKILSGDFRRL